MRGRSRRRRRWNSGFSPRRSTTGNWIPFTSTNTQLTGAAPGPADFTLVQGSAFSPSGAASFARSRPVWANRAIIRLTGQIVAALANVVYQLIVSYYIKDENDASFFSAASPWATVSDGRERIIRQYSKSQLSPAIGAIFQIDDDREWIMNVPLNRRVASDEVLVMSVAAYRMNPNYGQIVAPDLINFVLTGRIYVSSAG